jgi:hypothetical protein
VALYNTRHIEKQKYHITVVIHFTLKHLPLPSAAYERRMSHQRWEDVECFKWRGSKAKKVIVQGLENGEITDGMSPEEIFEKYNQSHPQHFQVVGLCLMKDRLK